MQMKTDWNNTCELMKEKSEIKDSQLKYHIEHVNVMRCH